MFTRHSLITTSQISDVVIVASDDDIVGLYFPGHWTKPDWATFGAEVTDDAVIGEAARQLFDYLTGNRTEFTFATRLVGNAFQQRVWALLQRIPFGETRTYGDLAEQLGDRNLARIVGQAVGHNPLSIFVGCHRVVGSTGKLTGYAGGIERKEFLLNLEEPERVKAGRLF